MKFKTKLFIVYGIILFLTVPAFIYAFCCHLMWVCLYSLLIVFITVILSVFLLREMGRRQKQITSDVAHELRTPLSCLKGSIEGLIDGVWEPTKERLQSCDEEIDRLSKLVSDLSLLTDFDWENIKLEKTEFDLAGLIEKTAEGFKAAAAQKGLSLLTQTESRQITADYDRLKQALVNLLANALCYTDGGAITVGNRGREIFVSDTGIGIEGADLPHIFDRFYRADSSRSRSSGGAGVGLAIAKAIVRAHGGAISAKSESGKGSVFTIAL